jgi:excisionase family DNA binding protein
VDDGCSLREAAAELGVHYQTAYGWVRAGRLDARKVGGSYLVSRAALSALARDRETGAPPPGTIRVRDWEAQVNRLFDVLRFGDELGARAVADRLAGIDVATFSDRILAPALRRVGEWWQAGELSVAEEHRAAAICERLLARRFGLPGGRPRGVVVVAAAPGDEHGLPAAMAAAALRADRWRVNHLGVGVPAADLLMLAEAVHADLAVLSVTTPERAPAAQRLAGRLGATGIPTLVGRPGATVAELAESARSVTAHR